MQINKYKYLTIPSYDSKLLVVYGEYSYVKKLIEEKYKIEIDYSSSYSCVDCFNDNNVLNYILYINKDWNFTVFDYGVIAHEAFHLAHKILENKKDIKHTCTIAITEDTSEPIAYLIEAIVIMVLKVLIKFKKR